MKLNGKQKRPTTRVRDSIAPPATNGEQQVADQQSSKATTPRQRLIVPALIGLILLVVLFAGGVFTPTPTVEPAQPDYLDVSVVQAAEQSHYQIKRSYLGKLESARNSKIGFELGGKLIALSVDEGDLVKQGEVLAELDTELLQSQFETLTARIENAQAVLDELIAGPRQEDIATAKANVQRWTAQLKLAQLSRERVLRLQRSGSVSAQETDESVYDEQAVAAQLDAAKSQLKELINGTRLEQIAAQRAALTQLTSERKTIGVRIKKSRLCAPYDGIVASRLLDEGEVIVAGQPVLELFDNDRIEARFGVPVGLVDAILSKETQRLVYSGREITAELKSVRPEKNSDTRTVDIVFRLPIQTIKPAIGDVVRMEILESVSADGFWVPSTSLVETYRGLWGCYVAESGKSASEALANTSLRELELLHQEDEMSFVRGALLSGERVISSGTHRLVNGQTVRVSSDAATSSVAVSSNQN